MLNIYHIPGIVLSVFICVTSLNSYNSAVIKVLFFLFFAGKSCQFLFSHLDF